MASNASFTSNSNVTPPSKQELLTAFLDLRKSPTNHEKLLEFVHHHYAIRLKISELDEPHIHCEARIAPSIFHDLSCLYDQQISLRRTLQSLDSISDEDLDRVNTWRKVSAVLLTAAAAVAAAVAAANTKRNPAGAAAAVSVLLVALGKWIHSILRKRESAAIKRKEIVGVMIFGAKMGIEYLGDIHALAVHLNSESESKPETVDGERKKLAVVEMRFEEIRGKIDDYNWGLKWAREQVLRGVITRLD